MAWSRWVWSALVEVALSRTHSASSAPSSRCALSSAPPSAAQQFLPARQQTQQQLQHFFWIDEVQGGSQEADSMLFCVSNTLLRVTQQTFCWYSNCLSTNRDQQMPHIPSIQSKYLKKNRCLNKCFFTSHYKLIKSFFTAESYSGSQSIKLFVTNRSLTLCTFNPLWAAEEIFPIRAATFYRAAVSQVGKTQLKATYNTLVRRTGHSSLVCT